MHVSAKDLGTGKEQKITVTSSTGLTQEDIEKLVKEAEAHAEEDRKKREKVELRNQADNAIWAIDRSLNELGDKVTADQKARVEAAKEELKAAMEKDDTEEIKAKMKALDEVMHSISQKLYETSSGSKPRPGWFECRGAA